MHACPSQVPDLSAMTALSHLEVSYNQIRSISPLSSCGALSLQELYISNNKLSRFEVRSEHLQNDHQSCALLTASFWRERQMSCKVAAGNCCGQHVTIWMLIIHCLQGCSHLTALKLLELGANRLTQVDGIESHPDLRELWLGSNRIAQTQSLSWYAT